MTTLTDSPAVCLRCFLSGTTCRGWLAAVCPRLALDRFSLGLREILRAALALFASLCHAAPPRLDALVAAVTAATSPPPR